jgi:hypothetical protein
MIPSILQEPISREPRDKLLKSGIIRLAAMADALAGSGKTVIPEEHQNLKHCLYVNKALNTQLNYELYHNHDARRHYI